MSAVVVTAADFERVVLEGSATRPVLVDFWAPWCAPCRSLAPVLDKLAAEFAGRFTLAKLDTDAAPDLAARFGVRSIPNCKLFVDGQVVDEFTGVLPEARLRDWLRGVLPSPAGALVAAAQGRLAAGDAAGALAELDEATLIDPDDEDLALTRIEALTAAGRAGEAAPLVWALEAPLRQRTRPVRDERRLAILKAKLALAEGEGTDLAALAQAVADHPADCGARLAHAQALAARGRYPEALDAYLAVVRADRTFGDDAGRKGMLTIFTALGPDSDLVRRYRRELAAAINR